MPFKGIEYLTQTLIFKLKFQTTTSVKPNNISLKYQKFTTLGSKDIETRKSEFVAKTQFLCAHNII